MTTTTTLPQPEQGQMVSVRSRNWMVTDVSASTLPPERLQTGLGSPQHLLTLSSVEDDDLAIADGDTAIAKYARMACVEFIGEAAGEACQALLEYCKRDSLAMVSLHERLVKLCR